MRFVVRGWSGKKPIRIVYLIPILILVPIAIILAQMIGSSPTISSINIWRISELNNIEAEILWQKSIPCLQAGFDDPNGITSVSDSQIVVSCYQPLTLNRDGVIALDLVEGEKQWQTSARNPLQITYIDNGFIIVFDDSTVKRLDLHGDETWRYKFPSRTVRTVIPCEGFICVPRGNLGIRHIRSSQTGENIEDVDIDYVFGVYSDVYVRNVNTRIEIIERDTLSTIWEVDVPYQLSYWNFARYEDIFLIHYGREYVATFSISNGTPIWEMQIESSSDPLLLNDKLYVYRPNNSLEIYDVSTGNLVGSVSLQQVTDNNTGNMDVALSGNSDLLSITYRKREEILLMRLNLVD